MKESWYVFYNKLTRKELSAITVDGTFKGEIQATIELNAYENKIGESDIEVVIEER